MPSRVIRGEINRSDSLSRVSIEAELTFDRLLLAVDDYGRLDARPAVLKAELFPLREDATPERIVKWIRELASILDAPVMLYQVGRRPYLVLTGWESHRGKGRRATESRFPEPPAEPEDTQEILPLPGVSRKSEDLQEILENPSNPPVGRGTRDEGRVARGTAETPAPPWGPLSNLLVSHGADPPPEPDEREAWLDSIWPEIEAGADADAPAKGDTEKKRSARVKRIAHARWRTYLRSGRIHRGTAERAKSAEAKRRWLEEHPGIDAGAERAITARGGAP